MPLTIRDLLDKIVTDTNAAFANYDFTDESEGIIEGQPDLNYVPITVERLLAELIEGFPRSGDEAINHALNGLSDAIVDAAGSVDPWPELNRDGLKFTIAGRQRGLPDYALHTMTHYGDGPLTIREKIIAARHRPWLEKDLEKRQRKLAKAQQIVREMGGVA